MGQEETPGAYVAAMAAVFREVRRVLRDDGTLWLNIGDSYAHDSKWGGSSGGKHALALHGNSGVGRRKQNTGLKSKDLIGIPWMLAFALRADGWYLRSDIIWHKPNPMPESTKDRPTSAHEHVFLLTKSAKYFYDADAIREPASEALVRQVQGGYQGTDTKDFAAAGAQSASNTKGRIIAGARAKIDKQRGHSRRHAGFNERWDTLSRDEQMAIGSNARNVWTIVPRPFRGAHFATFPPALVERCIRAGSRPGDTVLDPFAGAGTTGLVAKKLGRNAILCELNPAYVDMAIHRIAVETGVSGEMAYELAKASVARSRFPRSSGLSL